MNDWFDNGILGDTGQRIDYRKVRLVALQVDLGVRQLLAMNPGPPLWVSKKGEYQDVELRLRPVTPTVKPHRHRPWENSYPSTREYRLACFSGRPTKTDWY